MTLQESDYIKKKESEDSYIGNTKRGGKKLRQYMIAKHGSEEAWKNYMREVGAKGGRGSRGYKFAHGYISPSEAGKISANKKRNNINTEE